MVKKAHFYIVSVLFLFFGSIDHTANAQFTEDYSGKIYDPLEERLKVETAYIPNYRELMRDIVTAFGQYVQDNRPDFKIVTDSGFSLLTRGEWENDLDDLHRAEMAGAQTDDERFLLKLFSPEHPVPVGTPIRRYIQAINGLLLTNQICGDAKGKLSPENMAIVKEYGLSLIGVEHCATNKQMFAAQTELAKHKIPVYADTDKKARFDTLDPNADIFLENQQNTDSLDKVRNILIMMNTRNFSSKDLWLASMADTNYDMLIIEPFFRFNQPLTKEEVKDLQYKKIGSRRLVFAVMNVSMAEDTRFYWEKTWKVGDPKWLRLQSKINPAGVIVDYWHPAWKRILGVYFKSIMDLGFDGVILQGLDEHESYERIIPIN